MARPSAATAEKQPSVSSESTTRQRIVVAGLGRVGVDYACAFAMHPFAEVVGFVEPRGDLRRFARGVGFGAPSESTLDRWLEKRACDSVVVSAPADEALAIVERAVAAGLGVLVHGLAGMPGETATCTTFFLQTSCCCWTRRSVRSRASRPRDRSSTASGSTSARWRPASRTG